MVMLIFHPNSPRLLSETSSSAIPSGPDSCSVAHLYSSANTFYTLPTTEDKSLNRRTSWLWRCVLEIQSEWGQGSEVVGSGHSTRVLIRKNMCWTVIWNNILHKFFSLLSCLLFVVVVAGGVWTVVYHIIIITTYSGTALMDPDGKSKESYLLSQKEINTRKNIYLPTRLRVMLGFYPSPLDCNLKEEYKKTRMDRFVVGQFIHRGQHGNCSQVFCVELSFFRQRQT